MNDEAILIGLTYAGLVVAVVLLGVGLWASTKTRRRPDVAGLAEREKTWFVLVLAGLTALLASTIFFIPYDDTDAVAGAQRVRVVGQQFAWRVEPPIVRAGDPIEFVVESTDVNHGFGLYNADDELVFQVQAIPGHETRVVRRLDEPGTYRILCLEFCGAAHHNMVAQLEARR